MSSNFPIGTRWVAVTAYDAEGARLGKAVGDVLRFGTPEKANAQALHGLVVAFGERIARTAVHHGA